MNGTNDCVALIRGGEWVAGPCLLDLGTFLCQWKPDLDEAKINALERQLNATEQSKAELEHRTADLEAQTKLLKTILWTLVVTICVLVLLVVLVFAFRSIKGPLLTWWRRRDGSDRMNLLDEA